MQHLDHQVANRNLCSNSRNNDRDAALLGGRQQILYLRDRRRLRPKPHLADVDAPHHVGGAPDMVEMRMGDQQHVETAAAVAGQPAGSLVITTGVDKDPGVARLNEEGVTLPDIDVGNRQVARSDRA